MTPTRSTKSRWEAAHFAILLVPATVLIAHAALWPQGPWYDEYIGLALLNHMGLAGEWFRIIHWDPRPFSEFLLCLYGLAVRATGRPLVALANGSAWAILFMFLLAATKPWQTPGGIARTAMLLTLPAIFLLATPPEEMFYWPYAAAAYLPALGAACFATIQLAGPGLGDRRGWAALAAALVIGAASVEHGTFLAAIMAPFLLAEAATGLRAGRLPRAMSAGAVLLVSVIILALFWFGRVARASEMFGNPAIAHHIGADIRLTLITLAREFLHPPGWGAGAAILVKLMVFLGARHCLAAAWPMQPRRLVLLGLMAGLAGAAFLSVFGAYYNFGMLCCPRMASYRQALFLLMAVAGAGCVRPVRPRAIGVSVLALAALIHLQPRLVDIAAEYRLAGARAAARSETFASGTTPGPAPLNYVVAPSGPLFTYGFFPSGHYELTPKSTGQSRGPMMYFNKPHMWAHEAAPPPN